MVALNKAVFLDRDGVINNNSNHYYIYKEEQLQLNADIGQAIAKLKQSEFLVIIVSNQGGISKGIYTKSDVDTLHKSVVHQIETFGGAIDDIYYCPHHSDNEKCLCRKPNSLMIEKAVAVHHIDVNQSYLIGDGERDVVAGRKVGLTSYLCKANESIMSWVDKIISSQ